MNRLSILGILLILVSCGPNTSTNKIETKADTSTSGVEENKLSISPIDEPRKHETFNENIDKIPEVLKTFIPTGYSVINVSSGDANLDGLLDNILVLRKITEEATSNYADDKPDKRPLLLLLGQSDRSFKLAFRNDNAVYCIDCGGVFGDPFIGTTIKNGYFSIEHGIAGGHHWEQEITFRYDKLNNNWFLDNDHYVSYKLNETNDAEALVLDVDKMKTSKDFGIISFEKFNIYNEDGN
ncbi:MAG: hypothetical protein IT222_09895 [Crocinitomix sp.]|nr:hypothetical protein [Crocinitomix sp.]